MGGRTLQQIGWNVYLGVFVSVAVSCGSAIGHPETQAAVRFPDVAPSFDSRRLDSLQAEITELKRKIEKPPKDAWDKITSLSGLATGLVVALIGFYATNIYTRGQRHSAERRKERELQNSQVQTIEKFFPHLASKDENLKRGALIMISAMGNQEIAIKL